MGIERFVDPHHLESWVSRADRQVDRTDRGVLFDQASSPKKSVRVVGSQRSTTGFLAGGCGTDAE